MNLVDWIGQFTKETDATFLRSWLGRMLFPAEEAEKRFEAWKAGKEADLNKTKEQLAAEKAAAVKARLEVEAAQNKAKAEELAKKKAAELEAQAAAAKAEAEAEQAEETPATEAE